MINPTLYQSFYDAICPAVVGTPISRVSEGTIVFRSVAAQYNGLNATADSARTIFKGSVADNRWSGSRARGPGKGVLYVSMHLDAMSNELFYYADKKLPPDPKLGRVLAQQALAATRTFRFKLQRTVWLVDISLASPEGGAFIQRLGANAGVKAALATAGYLSIRQAYEAPADYSFTRALGHALLDTLPLMDGLKVTTARNEWAKIGETGENLALFGQDNVPFPYLEPLSETSYGVDPKGQLTQKVKHFP